MKINQTINIFTATSAVFGISALVSGLTGSTNGLMFSLIGVIVAQGAIMLLQDIRFERRQKENNQICDTWFSLWRSAFNELLAKDEETARAKDNP